MLLTPSFITVLCFVILLMKLRRNTLKKLLGFDIYLDVMATFAMMYLFAGTYSGMMVAMFGGFLFSVSLIGLKKIIGYMKLEYVNDDKHLFPTLRWKTIPGLLKETSNA